MSIELYCTPLGFPSRSAMLLARALNISLDLKMIDLFAGENRTEEFVQMNPQHSVPFMVDGDLSIAESSAIMMYLADEYGKDDSLYSKDTKQRAVINSRLFFSSTLANRFILAYIAPVLFKGAGIDETVLPSLEDAFNILNAYLEGKDWVSGDQITIADYAFVTIVSTAEALGYDVSKHENVSAWLGKCKETMEDYEDINQNNCDMIATFFAEKLSQIDS